jgi:hypothetical protein
MQPIVWITTLFMVAFHIGELAALFLFSWKALLLALAPWWAAGSLGIGIGYIGFLPIEAVSFRQACSREGFRGKKSASGRHSGLLLPARLGWA